MKLYNVKECQPDAVEVLWDLLRERPDYANISHDGKTTRNQHVAFVHGHPYREWCLIMAEGTWVGAVYITFENYIGTAILSKYKKRGYGKEAMLQLMERHRADYYYSNVAPNNKESHRMCERLPNACIVQLTYRYTRNDQPIKKILVNEMLNREICGIIYEASQAVMPSEIRSGDARRLLRSITETTMELIIAAAPTDVRDVLREAFEEANNSRGENHGNSSSNPKETT